LQINPHNETKVCESHWIEFLMNIAPQ